MADRGKITHLEGTFLQDSSTSFAIVASRFNQQVVDKLVEGAIEALREHGVSIDRITLVRVPGAWEIPFGCERMIKHHRPTAIVALGAVIRGETAHFDAVASESIGGCARVMLETGVPIGLGILTTDSLAQAMERAGGKMGNKGWEASLSALEMASLAKMLASPTDGKD